VLAYVFWHRPVSGADPDDYEAKLRAFHERLCGDPPAGFRGSAAFQVEDGYEDWYLVDDWTALGVLNDAAIDSRHAPDHDAVAGLAGGGAGAVYKHIAGHLDLADSGDADWSHSRPAAEGEFALWQRQLVLGPAPEFCLLRPGSNRVSVVSGPASI
jgi:hypothetical protein